MEFHLKKFSQLPHKARNLLDAVSQGCETGTRLVVSIVVNVLVYISLLSLVNSTLEWFGDRAGVANLSLTLFVNKEALIYTALGTQLEMHDLILDTI
ncbi:hypothetical protein KUTeg_021003 [Tegillarca granosa]|uniref:Concentrative nucleoside transporter C-terminal domain-containing protein n=1 Tax=Tegillarca granosa TaxID=220873 RepID=A0ABQ9E9J3_TEGGR|nr:hypothetical protein KUTeg_021003 [Tegillarca granosa]